MESSDLDLLARAAEELAILLEQHLGYPDNPEQLLLTEPKASLIVTDIFRRLLEEGAPIPAPIANLVTYLYAPQVFGASPA